MSTNIDTDAVRRIAAAADTLRSVADDASSTISTCSTDESAFGLLCGAIIAPPFLAMEAGAYDVVHAMSQIADSLAQKLDPVGQSYDDFDSDLANLLKQVGN
ncbi:MAG: hypothetical protein FWF75_04855 [Propionibacteriaceae bacterium]|nr:hypothetical protein [Propionibacteriaceae bacterium]